MLIVKERKIISWWIKVLEEELKNEIRGVS